MYTHTRWNARGPHRQTDSRTRYLLCAELTDWLVTLVALFIGQWFSSSMQIWSQFFLLSRTLSLSHSWMINVTLISFCARNRNKTEKKTILKSGAHNFWNVSLFRALSFVFCQFECFALLSSTIQSGMESSMSTCAPGVCVCVAKMQFGYLFLFPVDWVLRMRMLFGVEMCCCCCCCSVFVCGLFSFGYFMHISWITNDQFTMLKLHSMQLTLFYELQFKCKQVVYGTCTMANDRMHV